MTKANEIRAVVQRGKPVNTADVAAQVGCSQARVCQVITSMKEEGHEFDYRNIGSGRTSWRLLSDDEARALRRNRSDRERKRIVAEIDQALGNLSAEIEIIRTRLASLS